MISVLLPTVRPHLVGRALESVREAAGDVPYEVVVVADFHSPQEYAHCVWIERPRAGVVDAVNVAYTSATGTHLFLFNDESTLDGGALTVLLRESLFQPEALMSPRHEPVFPFVYYGLPFVPFPFARRGLFDQLGGLLDPVYKGFYADPDLSLRAHAKGVEIVTVDDAVLRHCNEHDLPHAQSVVKYLEDDRRTFRARWDYLGEFRDP